ncbi:MAG: SIMPL domain-containing protein [Microlunatus sp.]|nr:SIMPL domain-containing protein [Microlunatus sp.]
MAGSNSTLVSVRGDARLTVAPDLAVLTGVLRTTRDTKVAALQAAAAELGRLTDELGSLGGVPLTVDAARPPLGWLAYSAGTEPEHDQDPETGRYGPTGRMTASVAVTVNVRAFELLERLGAALAGQESFNVQYVRWDVDPDNPSWPEVRAAAIRNAISKGRDYAEALGGSLDHLEHIADAGLLGAGDGEPFTRRAPQRFAAASGAEAETPSLDPVPQELIAVIDARFAATVAGL